MRKSWLSFFWPLGRQLQVFLKRKWTFVPVIHQNKVPVITSKLQKKKKKKTQKLWLKETCFRRMTRRLHIEKIWWIQHFYKTFHTPYGGWPFWNPHLILSRAAKDVWYSFKTLNKFGGHLSRPRQKDAMWDSKTIRPSELPISRLDYI